jgi:signal transduction histidine kinase/FixJ family two-component response regulator
MFSQWLNDRTILERILIVNIAIIALMSALGLVTLNRFNQVIRIGQNIEDHPLVVNNAVLEIESSVSELNSYLKTALESRTPKAIDAYQQKMEALAPSIQDNFWLINDRFLGDLNMVHGASTNYLSWKNHNSKMMDSLLKHASSSVISNHSRESWLSRDLMADYLIEINTYAQTRAKAFIEGLQRQRKSAMTWTILFILFAAGLAFLLSILVGRTVAGPIRTLEKVMRALAQGSLDVNLPEISSHRFEAGAIARAAAEMKANAIEKNALVERAEQARIKAENANQAKSRFLAMMSHELRTPMNAILGSAQVLDAMKLDQDVREHVDSLTIGGETLMAILNDVLDLSKIESGKLSAEFTDFDITKLLHQAKSLWTPRAEDKALKLAFHIDKNVPQWIHSDSTRLRQIAFNLISNAIKFTQSGSVEVSLVQTGTQAGKAMLELSVKDTGIGIAAESLEKLFTPFAQADDSITRRFGGTGLGLSIARQLATLLEGELNVSSKAGKGSTFTLRFSAKPCQKPVEKRPTKTGETASQRQLRILVAEDNAMNVKVLQALLKPFPYDLIHAKNGEIALALLNKQAFDLVLMDIQMPVMDGMAATQALRKGNSPNQNIPVIAMTANAMQGDRESYIAAGMDGYVPKPIDARQLFSTIVRAAAQGQKGGATQKAPKGNARSKSA